jgi:hypothetical protein
MVWVETAAFTVDYCRHKYAQNPTLGQAIKPSVIGVFITQTEIDTRGRVAGVFSGEKRLPYFKHLEGKERVLLSVLLFYSCWPARPRCICVKTQGGHSALLHLVVFD